MGAVGTLDRGLYEVLLTEALRAELRLLDPRLESEHSTLRPAEAGDRIARTSVASSKGSSPALLKTTASKLGSVSPGT